MIFFTQMLNKNQLISFEAKIFLQNTPHRCFLWMVSSSSLSFLVDVFGLSSITVATWLSLLIRSYFGFCRWSCQSRKILFPIFHHTAFGLVSGIKLLHIPQLILFLFRSLICSLYQGMRFWASQFYVHCTHKAFVQLSWWKGSPSLFTPIITVQYWMFTCDAEALLAMLALHVERYTFAKVRCHITRQRLDGITWI